jgi:hypothetical protein
MPVHSLYAFVMQQTFKATKSSLLCGQLMSKIISSLYYYQNVNSFESSYKWSNTEVWLTKDLLSSLLNNEGRRSKRFGMWCLYNSDMLIVTENKHNIISVMPTVRSVFHYWIMVFASHNANSIPSLLCLCFTCTLMVEFLGQTRKGQLKKCIRVANLFSDRPYGLISQVTKDSSPLSIILQFSQQSSRYRWMRQLGTITSIWTPMKKDLCIIWHNITLNLCVFCSNHGNGMQSLKEYW